MSRGRTRLRSSIFALLVLLACAACSAERRGAETPQDNREILDMTQNYLMDQANSVTENKQFNRNLGTNRLPLDRVTGALAEQLRTEIPKIAQRRDKWRGTPEEYDWALAKMIAPKVSVSDDTATVMVTEATEMHYTFGEPSTSYSVGHKLEFVRTNGVWKIANDKLDVPPGAPLLLEGYAR